SINRNSGVSSGVEMDGRYVAYTSDATNLVANDTNAISDIFVYDRETQISTRVSVSSAGGQATDPTDPLVTGSHLGSLNPSISATGRYVAFASLANNLASGDRVGRYDPNNSGNSGLNVYMMDRDFNGSGAAYDPAGIANISTTNVSVNRFGFQAIY